MTAKLRVHPVASLFPEMGDIDYFSLKEDIKQRGLQQPILLSKDGRIVDGRHRYRACVELKIVPTYVRSKWDDDDTLARDVISLNLKRRHLSESQQSMVGSRAQALFEASAKKRAEEGRKAGGEAVKRKTKAAKTKKNQEGGLSEKVHSSPHRAADDAANLVGVNTRLVQHGTRVLAKGVPELIEAVDRGEIPVTAASSLAKKGAKFQKQVVTMLRKGKAKNVRDATRKLTLAEQLAKIEAAPPVVGEFGVLVVDPPWQFDKTREDDPTQRGRTPYPTMTEDAIKAIKLPIGKDAIVWLWCVDTAVEALTRRGWRKYDSLSPGDEIVGFDTALGMTVWQPIKEIGVFPYEGESVAVHRYDGDFLCHTTPNHRWWSANPGSSIRKWRQRFSQDFLGLRHGNIVPASAERESYFPKTEMISDRAVQLVAWLTTDGSIQYREHQNRGPSATIYQCEKSQYVSEITRLVGKEPKSYRHQKEKGWDKELVWLLPVELTRGMLLPFIAANKQPRWDTFYSLLTARQARLFVETCINGDGGRLPYGTKALRQQANRPLLDDVQALVANLGNASFYRKRLPAQSSWKTVGELLIAKRGVISIKAKKSQYKGLVWCPSVASGHWLARANGRTFITGNTTNAHLVDGQASRILAAWGLSPKTMLTWVKPKFGIGDWLRGQTEHCILATKGRPVVTPPLPSTVLHADAGVHSEKPDAFYRLVEQLCPGTKGELFSRKAREGWNQHGVELGSIPATPAPEYAVGGDPAGGPDQSVVVAAVPEIPPMPVGTLPPIVAAPKP